MANAAQISWDYSGAAYQVPNLRTINNCPDWAFPLMVKITMLTYAAIAVVAAGREIGMGIEHSPQVLPHTDFELVDTQQYEIAQRGSLH